VTEDCLAVWCAGEEWCALTCAAEVLDRKWAPVVVDRLLADGPLGFAALEDAVDGVASNVLSNTLEDLAEHGIVERSIVSDRPVRVEYALTERGRDLAPVVDALSEWGERHLVAPDGC